jgi:hypothetical protein
MRTQHLSKLNNQTWPGPKEGFSVKSYRTSIDRANPIQRREGKSRFQGNNLSLSNDLNNLKRPHTDKRGHEWQVSQRTM